tara:strand:- start:471 stop:620 length:150 start_codon:yes stop_codon:yes gene_type:complete
MEEKESLTQRVSDQEISTVKNILIKADKLNDELNKYGLNMRVSLISDYK